MGYLYPILFFKVMSELSLCTFVFHLCKRDTWEPLDLDQYVNYQLAQKPEIAQGNNFINSLYESESDNFNSSGRELMRFAVLTDTHIEPFYLEHSKASNCG